MEVNLIMSTFYNGNFEEFNTIFKEHTGHTYEEYLHQQYVIENKTRNEIAKTLGVKETTIASHSRRLNIKRDTKKKIDENKIYKYTIKDIENQTGEEFIVTYNRLIEQGKSQSEIVKELKIKSVGHVTGYISKIKERELRNNTEPTIKGLSGKNLSTIERIFNRNMQIEYKDYLIEQYIGKGLSMVELSVSLGLSKTNVEATLRNYGIKKTSQQQRADAVKKGLIDYSSIGSKSRKTRSKSFSNSNNQELFRENLRYYFEIELKKLNLIDIEVIIGFNDWGILKDKEVDIPIIFILKDQFVKYSIEYNGVNWHTETQDDSKKIELELKGWNHYIVMENNGDSGNLGLLESRAKNLADTIIKDYLTKVN